MRNAPFVTSTVVQHQSASVEKPEIMPPHTITSTDSGESALSMIGAHSGLTMGAHTRSPMGAHTGSPLRAHTGSPMGAHTGSPLRAHTGSPMEAHTGSSPADYTSVVGENGIFLVPKVEVQKEFPSLSLPGELEENHYGAVTVKVEKTDNHCTEDQISEEKEVMRAESPYPTPVSVLRLFQPSEVTNIQKGASDGAVSHKDQKRKHGETFDGGDDICYKRMHTQSSDSQPPLPTVSEDLLPGLTEELAPETQDTLPVDALPARSVLPKHLQPGPYIAQPSMKPVTGISPQFPQLASGMQLSHSDLEHKSLSSNTCTPSSLQSGSLDMPNLETGATWFLPTTVIQPGPNTHKGQNCKQGTTLFVPNNLPGILPSEVPSGGRICHYTNRKTGGQPKKKTSKSSCLSKGSQVSDSISNMVASRFESNDTPPLLSNQRNVGIQWPEYEQNFTGDENKVRHDHTYLWSKAPSTVSKKGSFAWSTENHCRDVLKWAKEMWEDEALCDLVIDTDDGSVKTHRLVMASVSPHIKRFLMKTPGALTADLHMRVNATSAVVRDVISFAYTGDIVLDKNNIYGTKKAAKELGIKKLLHVCKVLEAALTGKKDEGKSNKKCDKNEKENVESNRSPDAEISCCVPVQSDIHKTGEHSGVYTNENTANLTCRNENASDADLIADAVQSYGHELSDHNPIDADTSIVKSIDQNSHHGNPTHCVKGMDMEIQLNIDPQTDNAVDSVPDSLLSVDEHIALDLTVDFENAWHQK